IVQTLMGLSRRLVPNLALKMIGRLGSHEDYATAGADLGMTPEQIAWAKLHLQPGWFIGQMADGEWREPFLFQVPLVNLPEALDDAEAAESVKPLERLPVVPAPEFNRWQPHHVADVSAATRPAQPDLPETALRFLKAVIAHPGKPSGAYAKLASL